MWQCSSLSLLIEGCFMVTPISEDDQYFMDPKVKLEIMEGIAQHKAGKTTRVDPKDFDKLLGL
jgi:antitoxin YefM